MSCKTESQYKEPVDSPGIPAAGSGCEEERLSSRCKSTLHDAQKIKGPLLSCHCKQILFSWNHLNSPLRPLRHNQSCSYLFHPTLIRITVLQKVTGLPSRIHGPALQHSKSGWTYSAPHPVFLLGFFMLCTALRILVCGCTELLEHSFQDDALVKRTYRLYF